MRHEPPKGLTEYLESQYYLAWSDYRCACAKHDREAQWEARRDISRLEQTAAETCGFAYAEYLRRCYGHYDEE